MYFDALTTAAVADELRECLVDGRVQQVVHVDDLTLGLEIYAQHQRHYLLASADARGSRVQLTGVKLRRGVDTPVPMLLLLRKHVRGARILGVRQPPFERLLHLDLGNPEGTFTLTVEAMGRHANVILCAEDGQVMDSIKRVGPRLSRVRPMLPGTRYELPPPQEKLAPADVTERLISEMIDEARAKQPVWRILVNGIRGISPLLGREMAYRAYGETELRSADLDHVAPLCDAFQELMQHAWDHAWQPCVALQEGEIVAYAPYTLTQYPDRESLTSISEAVDRYEGAQHSVDAYRPAKDRVRASLDEARKRVNSRLEALERQLIPQEELDQLRLSGEMILAYAHAVQRGQKILEAQVAYEGPPMVIALNPDLSAVENAQSYFKRYEKAKAAVVDLPRLIKRARLQVAYLEQLGLDLELAGNRPEIDEVRTALADGGYIPKKRGSQPQRGQPLRRTSEDGLLILVGRSARQNHEVTFRRAAPDDLWLHAVDRPGSHVVVKSGGGVVPERTLLQAAALAAYYSAGRSEAAVLVAYTERRYVRQIRGAGPGMVTYRHEQTVRVPPKA